jgi:quinoprotein glucose dehydrogenase
MDTGSLFLPPSFRGSVALPQFNGGTDWGGAAFDPTTGVLYVNASNEAEWISMVEARPRTEMTLAELGSHLYQTHCAVCHGYDRTQESELAPNAVLGGLGQRRSQQQVLSLLKEGLGRMPSFAGLTSLEQRALIAFLFETGIDERIGLDDLAVGISTEIPYVATGHRILRDPEGFPANRRPWGTLNAIDLNAGNIIWQVALGTYPALEARGLPPTGTFNMGGPLVTAGGLVFIGATMDERFRAFDKETGEQLWEYQLDAGGYATPATFDIEGKQFVVIAAGGGGKPETRPGDAFYCFALP